MSTRSPPQAAELRGKAAVLDGAASTQRQRGSLGHLKLRARKRKRGNLTPEQSKQKAARSQKASLTVPGQLERQWKEAQADIPVIKTPAPEQVSGGRA